MNNTVTYNDYWVALPQGMLIDSPIARYLHKTSADAYADRLRSAGYQVTMAQVPAALVKARVMAALGR